MQLPFSQEIANRKLYHGRIRAGQFGEMSEESFTVWQFPESQLAFLHPMPAVDYTRPGYRESVNGSADVADYFRLHDAAQPAHLQLINHLLCRGSRVVDCGCGGGSLLNLVRCRDVETVAIEPFSGFHASLESHGHQVFESLTSALATEAGQCDLALSFHVIEHTVDPIAYLRDVRALLRPGARAFVLTPNLDNILLKVDFDGFASFFFRVAHSLYFNAKALEWAATAAGFVVKRTLHYHEFGLANTLYWLRDHKPCGHLALTGIDHHADSFWRSYLEHSGLADNVAVELENPA